MPKRTVYVHVRDFGYGPSTGFLDVVESFRDEYRWVIFSSGNALAYLQQQLPGAAFHAFDGYDKSRWPDLFDLVPVGSVTIAFSNPQFAAWATRRYRSVLIDQLSWMWPSTVEGLDRLELHLVQEYFGLESGVMDGGELVAPIVSLAFQNAHDHDTPNDQLLVGFGGMSVAGSRAATDDYARWLLEIVGPEARSRGIPIALVGGSPALATLAGELKTAGSVASHIGLGRREYARTLTAARAAILSPGLATIFESALLARGPLFQPGHNKSMLLQLDAVRRLGYEHVITWPFVETDLDRLRALPQDDALRDVRRLMDEAIASPAFRATVSAAIGRYLDDPAPPRLDLPSRGKLPDAGSRLREYLAGVE